MPDPLSSRSGWAAFWAGFREGLRQSTPFYGVASLAMAVVFDEPAFFLLGLLALVLWMAWPKESR